MKKGNLKVVKLDKNKSLFNYEKKILIKELTLDLKLGYYEFEKEKPQKVKFSLEIDYENKKPTSDKDIKSIVCLLYTSPSPRDGLLSRMPSSA